MIRTGIRYDEDGRPVGSVSRDEGPSVGLQASGWKGSLVVGTSGARMRPEGAQSALAQAERLRAFHASLTEEQRAERGRKISAGKRREK